MPILELRLRGLRQRRGLTQKQLAERVAVTQATIAHWETGESRCLRLETIERLCHALRVSPGDLIRTRPGRPSKYETRIRGELAALRETVAAKDDKEKRAQLDFGDSGTDDTSAHKATMRILNSKNALDGRDAASHWLSGALAAAEHGTVWKAVSLAYDAGFDHGLVWGRVWLGMDKFREHRDYGARPAEGKRPRGRPPRATDEQILAAAVGTGGDVRRMSKLLRLGGRQIRRRIARIERLAGSP